jgi:hypothetical protein
MVISGTGTGSSRSVLSVHPSLPNGCVDEAAGENAESGGERREQEEEDNEDSTSQDAGEGNAQSCESLLKSTDWSLTPLGPREQWPGSLKTVVSICLKTPSDSVICSSSCAFSQGRDPWTTR